MNIAKIYFIIIILLSMGCSVREEIRDNQLIVVPFDGITRECIVLEHGKDVPFGKINLYEPPNSPHGRYLVTVHDYWINPKTGSINLTDPSMYNIIELFDSWVDPREPKAKAVGISMDYTLPVGEIEMLENILSDSETKKNK